ncbi:MAG: hypothetical protein F4Y77_12080 [Holophagales bacterium]|nr:hypothetical protein [Holophagales bacterium]
MHERSAAASRLEQAGLDPRQAAAVIAEIDRGESRFATRDQLARVGDQVARIEVGLADLRGEVRQVEARLSGRLDATDARLDGIDARLDGIDARLGGIDARLGGVDGRFDGVKGDLVGRMNDLREELLGRMNDLREEFLGRMNDLREELLGRMDAQFAALRRENRVLLLFFTTVIGLLMALFRYGVL